MERTCLVVAAALVGLLAAAPTWAGHALVDLLDAGTLEQVDPNASVAPDKLLDLLLVEVVRERVSAGALSYATAVPLTPVAGDPMALGSHTRLAVGELLQLALLTRSRSALATLATAVGPGRERARQRMRRAASRLALRGSIVPDDWLGGRRLDDDRAVRDAGAIPRTGTPAATSPQRVVEARTSLGDLARLAGAVAGDVEIRRRLALDGVPIADGAMIVRATDPLFAPQPSPAAPTRAGGELEPAMAIEERDGLALLAVASGPEAPRDAWRVMERGLTRYRRVEIVRAGQAVGGDVEAGGEVAHVTAVAAQSFALTIPRSGAFALRAWLQLHVDGERSPASNQSIGELVFEQSGRIVGAVPLMAPPPNTPTRWLDTARR